MNINEITSSFVRHKEEPDIDIESYIRRLRVLLGASISKKNKIYLDLRYWIFIRDAYLGVSKKPIHDALLKSLRIFVKSGLGLCPISESVFCELNKQTDMQTRKATSELIDELSLGVTICPFEERVGTEIASFLYKSAGLNTYSLQELVWIKLSYVLGIMWPTNTAFDSGTERVVQKAFTDHMWSTSLTEIIETLGNDETIKSPMFNNLAMQLNADSDKHKDEIVSFEQAYRAEVSGGFSLFKSTAADIMVQLLRKKNNDKIFLSEKEKANYEDELHAFFVNLLCAGKVSKELPSLHVHAKCHAAIRWDKKRKIKPNDIYDLHHAASAVGYCDAFFTEKPLKVMLTSKNVALDKELSCKVISEEEDALEYLDCING